MRDALQYFAALTAAMTLSSFNDSPEAPKLKRRSSVRDQKLIQQPRSYVNALEMEVKERERERQSKEQHCLEHAHSKLLKVLDYGSVRLNSGSIQGELFEEAGSNRRSQVCKPVSSVPSAPQTSRFASVCHHCGAQLL